MKSGPKLRDVQFIWDRHLAPGQIQMGMDGVWHVGQGTDVQAILFRASLTKFDEKLLHDLKVEVD
jgi:hypothetical protein